MAVINDYVDSNLATATNRRANSLAVARTALYVAAVTFEVAAADSDTSIYRLFKGVNPELIPIKIDIFNDAITAGSVYDLGFYESLEAGGAVIDADALMVDGDLSSAHASGSPLSGMKDVDPANLLKRVYELAGHTFATKKTSYDIALTADTVGTGAGTVTVVAYFAQG
jgi:hypothetical protein